MAKLDLSRIERMPRARELLTVTETADLLACGRMTIYRMLDAGKLREVHIGMGNRKRVTRESVEEFLAAAE